MRILIIDNSIGSTGAINAILEIVNNLNKQHTFIFIVPSGSMTISTIEQFGYQVYEFNFLEINRSFRNNLNYPIRLIKNAILLKKIIIKDKIDIVQVNDLYNLTAILTKILTKIKVITHVRRMPNSFPKIVYAFWVLIHKVFSDKILPVSNANKHVFKNSSKTEVFYDPQPSEEVSFEYDCDEKSQYKILYLANYMAGKGQNHAIKVLKNLNENLNLVELHFYGDTFNNKNNVKYLKTLKLMCENHKIKESVYFHNATSKVVDQFKFSDLVLNFSDSESLSRVTMEALYFGVPIIATNVGGTNEMIINDYTGILVPQGNIEEMTSALVRLMYNKDLRAKFSENGKMHLKTNFDLQLLSNQLNNIYNSLK